MRLQNDPENISPIDKKSSQIKRLINTVATTVVMVFTTGVQKPKIIEPSQRTLLNDRPAIVQHLERKYGVSIIFEESSKQGKMRYEPSEYSSEFFNQLETEFAKFPKNMIRESGLKKIYFVNELQHHNEHKNSELCTRPWCKKLEFLCGYEDDKNRSIYITRTLRKIDTKETEIFDTLRHELFHFFDETYNGELAANIDNKPWTYLNGKKFKYRGDDWQKHARKYIKKRPYIPGFASNAGLKSPNEDEALTLEALTSEETSLSLLRRAKKDKVLKKKIEVLTGCELDTETLKFTKTYSKEEYIVNFPYPDINYYLAWSHGVMNHEWWNNYLAVINKKSE